MSRADQLERKIRNLMSRGVIKRISYDGKIRRMQCNLRRDFPVDGLEHIEPYGFSSHPLPGAEVVVASLGGNRSRAYILMAHDRRHKLVLSERETALYTDQGEVVHLRADQSILVKSASKVILDSPEAEITQRLTVNGESTFKQAATFEAEMNHGGKRVDSTHTHDNAGAVQ